MKKVITKNAEGQVIKIQTIYEGKTKTQQQFKELTDVNRIIAKYQKTGQMDHLKQSKGVFADMSFVGDYQESLNKVIEANKSFSELNSQTRNRFGNDPQQLIDFLADPKNEQEAVKLGLIVPKETPKETPKVTPQQPDKSPGGAKT